MDRDKCDLTLRAADTATPWASRGGWAGKIELVAKALDGAAVPLTQPLGLSPLVCATVDLAAWAIG